MMFRDVEGAESVILVVVMVEEAGAGGRTDQYSLLLPFPIVHPQSSRLRRTESGLVNL